MATAGTVSIAAGTVLNTWGAAQTAANVPTYDDQFAGILSGSQPGSIQLPNSPAMFKASGMQAIRYPGGSVADEFHPFGISCYLNSIVPSGGTPGAWTTPGVLNPAPDPTQWLGVNNAPYCGYIGSLSPDNGLTNIAEFFANIVVPQNLNVIYQHSYGTNVNRSYAPGDPHQGFATAGGDPVEAACIAQWFKTNGYDARVIFHEIGNECYGSTWEADMHGQGGAAGSTWDATTYGQQYLLFQAAIKAILPNAKVSAVLYLPTAGNGSTNWNATVLGIIGSQMDACSVHLYPINQRQESDTAILSASYTNGNNPPPATLINGGTVNGQTYPGVRQLLQTYCGSNPLGYQHIPILWSEVNITPSYATLATTGPVGALFLADYVHTIIDAGCANVTWHDYHNGANGGPNGSMNGTSIQSYPWGDYGLISSNQGYSESSAATANGAPGYGAPSISDGWVYPKYYAMQLLNSMGTTGDSVVSATSNQTLVRSHAVYNANGALHLMLVNTDLSNSYTETVSYTGFTGTTVASKKTFDLTDCPITSPTPTPVTAPTTSTITASSTGFTDTITPGSITVYTIAPPGGIVQGQTITISGTSVVLASGTTTVAPGGNVTVNTNVQGTVNGGPYGCEWLIYDPTGALQSPLPQITTGTLSANTPVALQQTYAIPLAAASGTWTAKAQVMSPDYATTVYATDATAVSFVVQSTGSSGGNSPPPVVSSPATIDITTVADATTSDGFLHQAAVALTPGTATAYANAKAPVMAGVDLSTLSPTTLATDAQLKQIAFLLSGNGSLRGGQLVQWLMVDPRIGSSSLAARTSADAITSTGALDTGTSTYIALQIILSTQTASTGTPQVQFWLERGYPNGEWDPTPLWTIGPIQGTTPNQTIFQVVTARFSGPDVTFGVLTDQTRLRWQVSNTTSGILTSSLFSAQVWAQ